jgi:acetyl-CoA/propionyl-CoA carboxylase biotin carboxyl carrier protein
VTINDRHWQAGVRLDADGLPRVSLDGIERRYATVTTDDVIWISRDGHHLELLTERASAAGPVSAPGLLQAPMPGTVLLVHVANGDLVARGDVLLVLESMKMELQVIAPTSGTVGGLTVSPGDRVAAKQRLVVIVHESEEQA